MVLIAEKDFKTISNREFWITNNGDKLYPSEIEDDHLINIIRFLASNARQYRNEDIRKQIESSFKVSSRHKNISMGEFLDVYSNHVKYYKDSSISDIDWLHQNSKIFTLLIEEATYRELVLDKQPQKPMATKKIAKKRGLSLR